MSLKKHQVWAMMPLLGILLMSPNDVTHKYGRHIASEEPIPATQEEKPEVVESKPQADQAAPQVEEPKPQADQAAPQVAEAQAPKPASQTPKLDALLPASEIQSIPAREVPANLSADSVKEEISSVLSKIHEAEAYDRNTVTAEQLAKVESIIRDGAIQLVQVERNLSGIGNEEAQGDLPERIRLARVSLEASLVELDESERIVAARTATPAQGPTVATTPAPSEDANRTPSVVTEETKPETKPEPTPATATAETKPAESKPAESKPESTEKDPILCALEEQNKLLQTQLQSFVQQQSLIMQQLMSLTQLVMMQSMYRTPDTFNYRDVYQYNQPQVAGNWVYYPNGLQPIQPGQTMPGQPDAQASIFGLNQPQPQMNQYNPYMMGQQQQFPFAQPGMMNQGGMWGLQPQMQFQHNPGNFGMDALGFNFGSAPAAPTQQFMGGFNPGVQFI